MGTKGFDIFGNLNDFLNKDDDSFKFDSVDTPDSSTVDAKSPEITVEAEEVYDLSKNSSQTEIEIDLSGESETLSQRTRSRAARKRAGEKLSSSQEFDESFDLTGDTYSPVRKCAKSRRKLADEVDHTVSEEINLCDVDSPVREETTIRGRGGRKRGRGRGAAKSAKATTRKPRMMSYKKALEIINQPIPDPMFVLQQQQLLAAAQSSSSTTATRQTQYSGDRNAVDLTGEVTLTDKHNTAPLFQKGNKQNEVTNNNLDFDDIDLDSIFINVRIKDNIKKFKHKSNLRFFDLFKSIAESENVPLSHIFCFNGDKRVYPDSTPDSIGHKVSSIYTCRLMDSSSVEVSNRKDKIELKFQSDKWKKPIALKVSRVGTFSTFINMLCEQIEFKADQISLSFDGDSIDQQKTPMDYELEGGEILDCLIKA